MDLIRSTADTMLSRPDLNLVLLVLALLGQLGIIVKLGLMLDRKLPKPEAFAPDEDPFHQRRR